MRLERTLPAVWQLCGADVPALAGGGRDTAVVVDDVETLCASIVRDQEARGVVHLELVDLYEALAFLLGQVVLLLPRYDPTRGRRVHDPWTAGFRAWLHLELSRDLIDHWRSTFGRNGHKHVFDTRPFEREEDNRLACILEPVDPIEDGSDAHADRLVRALEGVTTDDPDDWLDGRVWAGRRRDRKTARQKQAVGLGAPARAASRDRGTADREERAA